MSKKIIIKNVKDIKNLGEDDLKQFIKEHGLPVYDKATIDQLRTTAAVYLAMSLKTKALTKQIETAKQEIKDLEEEKTTTTSDLEAAIEKSNELQEQLDNLPESTIDLTDEESLKNHAKDLIARTNEFNEALEAAPDREEFIREVEEQLNLQPGAFQALFPSIFTSDQSDPVVVNDDLPVSDIFTTLNVRVLNQTIVDLAITYPFMSIVVTKQTTLGVNDIFYKDYTDTDSQAGYDDVTINDFNPGTYKRFKETFKVDTNIHKGYAILNSVLNDIVLTPGLFAALINDFTYAIARPFAKKMFSRFINKIDDDTFYDEVVALPKATDTDGKIKALKTKLLALSTPSRSHLKKLPNGATIGLEYQSTPSNLVLILNSDLAVKYAYDTKANAYNIGQVEVKVGQVIESDLSLIEAYSDNSTKVLAGYDMILMEKGVYEEYIKYSATTSVNTPKLKTVFHRYDRLGNLRRKDKIAIAFKTLTA